MWADVEAKVDFLNYSEVADLAVDVIRNPLLRPVSVGIFGTWGTGKSTLLNLIEDALVGAGRQPDFIVVRFDAWLYQGFDDSRAALMEVIATRLEKAAEGNETWLAKAKKFSKRVHGMRLLGLLAEGGAAITGHHTGGVLSLGAQALSDMWSGKVEKNDDERLAKAGEEIVKKGKGILKPAIKRTPPKQIDAFRKEFAELVIGLGKTLVVFIDNLDRCLPTQTINTLEALRLFLFMPHTAYVIAADEEMVRHSVLQFFKDLDERHTIDYLDKLIQVPIRLPRLGVQEVRAYLFLLFAAASEGIPAESVEALRAGLEDSLRRSWKDEPISTERALGLLGRDRPKDVVEGFSIADRIAPLLANSSLVGGNPRIVKRMLNVIRMRGRLATLRNIPFDEALIAKLALFERCMDAASVSLLYSAINEAAGGKPPILTALEAAKEDPEALKLACPEAWAARFDFLRDWLALDPMLNGVDLRPAVYLSRETVPVRAVRSDLSAPAVDGLKLLLRATSLASPSGKAAATTIPTAERVAVMATIIDELRQTARWNTKPRGFDGAWILGSVSEDAMASLANFVRHHFRDGKMPPWLSALLKTTPGFKKGEER